MIFAVILLAGLAVGQVVRVVVKDDFPFGPAQRWLEGHHGGSWLQLMVSCPWCLSGWVSLAATGALEWRHSLPVPLLAWLAVWRLGVASYWAAEALAKYGAEDGEPPATLDDRKFS